MFDYRFPHQSQAPGKVKGAIILRKNSHQSMSNLELDNAYEKMFIILFVHLL
jgi:hypothetical protein